jgi:polysaccharide biosynthesis protein PslH
LKILQLAPKLPYPLVDGGSVGIFKSTEATAKAGADITFVTYPDPDPQVTRKGIEALSAFARVHLVSKQLPSRYKTLAKTMFKGAYPVERRMMPEMFELLTQLVDQHEFDLVHVDHAHMGKYAIWLKETYGLPYVLREHNFEALIYERFAATQRDPLKKFVASTHGRRLKKEEFKFIREAAHVVPITKEDLSLMRNEIQHQRYTVISSGVDTDYFRPSNKISEEKLITWIGGMSWDPNRDAVLYFLDDIWPRLSASDPDLRLELIGDGTEALVAKRSDNVKGFGRVPDVRPYFSRATLLVVPLRVGGGMRLKILDFLASGKAVVTTSIGMEGNRAEHDKHLMIADTPSDFARQVLALLGDSERRNELGSAGRALTEECYSWKKIGQQFVAVYEAVIARQSAPISAQPEL